MTNRPKTLALLISLIGVGVSPLAQAHTSLRVVRVPVIAPRPALEVRATALDLTRWSPGLVWRSERDAPDPAQLWLIARTTAAVDADWAPGEASGPPASTAGARGDTAAEQAEASTAPAIIDGQADGTAVALLDDTRALVDADAESGGHAAPAQREAVDAQSQSAPIAQAQEVPPQPSTQRLRWLRAIGDAFGRQREAADHPAIVRPALALAPLDAGNAVAVALPHIVATSADATPRTAATLRLSAKPTLPTDAQAVSAHADGLMASLAAVLLDDVSPLDRERVLTRLVERFPALRDEPSLPEPWAVATVAGGQAHAHRAESREIAVVSPSAKVLRNLEAIMLGDRDPFGAIKAAPSELMVVSQADRVLSTLQDFATTRRTRELSAAMSASQRSFAKSRAKAKAATVATLAAMPMRLAAGAAERVDIDVMLPILAQEIATSATLAPLAVPATLAEAAPQQPRTSPFGDRALAVNETSLDRVRGGFVTESLNISFGIERAVYVNGALVTTTSLNVSDLGKISAGRGTTAFDSGTLALVQSGAGNSVSAGSISPTSLGTVIQNTLDGQKIQNVTVINATVNSLGILRGLNLQSSLRGAVIDSLRR